MKVWCHLHNENLFADKVVGHWIWSARWWLHFGQRWKISAEWSLLHKAKSSFGFTLEFGHGDGDDGIMFHAALPFLFSIFIAVDGILPRRLVRARGIDWPRRSGFNVHHGTLWIYFFENTMSWSKSYPWYSKALTLNISDWILGKPQYSEEDHTEWQEIVVPMPEACYHGKVRFFTGTWKRRFSTKRIRRCDVSMYQPVPFPGKGENSWDCGEDATHGLVAPHGEMHEAIASMVEHVMRQRCRYGNGIRWRPKPKELILPEGSDTFHGS